MLACPPHHDMRSAPGQPTGKGHSEPTYFIQTTAAPKLTSRSLACSQKPPEESAESRPAPADRPGFFPSTGEFAPIFVVGDLLSLGSVYGVLFANSASRQSSQPQ